MTPTDSSYPDRPRHRGEPVLQPTLPGPGAAGFHVPAAPPAVPGFEIVRELGRGGMGVVYLARQVGLNRQVALKMVLAGGHATAGERQRFLAEAEAVAAAQHPGIVQVYEYGTAAGQPYFALEYLPGGTLADRLNGTPLPARDAAELVEQLAEAVQAAHDRRIIHRDLKPANVLFAADGAPKVTDFGLARRGAAGSGLTATGAILGSPSYMAPEQADGRHAEVGPGADVYALGAILYECLTGRPPFRAASPLETLAQVIRDDPLPPSRLMSGLPRDLETIALKCLAKDPARRYPSAAALAADLRAFLDGRPIVARPVGAAERAWKMVRRRPAVAALAAALFATTAAIVALVVNTNARLQEERDAAARERDLARVAEADADAQRRRADARLARAVEAVEKMMVRVAGERWVRRPDLQQERRQVLEDAAAFYDGFLGDEGQSPVVRREAARAQYRLAAAYLGLADYARASRAAEQAVDLYRGLAREYPDDPRYANELAGGLVMLGNVRLVEGRYGPAEAVGLEAEAAAHRAFRADPSREAYRATLVETLLYLTRYYTSTTPRSADGYLTQARALVEELGRRPDAPFVHRYLLAECELNAARLAYMVANLPDALARLDQADRLLAGLRGEVPPSARYAESFDNAQAVAAATRGTILARLDRPNDALPHLERGVELLDRLLEIQPRSFQLRLRKADTLMHLADVLRLTNEPDQAARRRTELDLLLKQVAADAPEAGHVPNMVANLRSGFFVVRARAGDLAGFDATAAELLSPGGLNPYTAQMNKYNVACALAQAGHHVPPARRAAYLTRAVELLIELAADGYFRREGVVGWWIDADPDLDPLRDRDDYRRFREKLTASRPPAPALAPPARAVPSPQIRPIATRGPKFMDNR